MSTSTNQYPVQGVNAYTNQAPLSTINQGVRSYTTQAPVSTINQGVRTYTTNQAPVSTVNQGVRTYTTQAPVTTINQGVRTYTTQAPVTTTIQAPVAQTVYRTSGNAHSERRLDDQSARILARKVFGKYDDNHSGYMNSMETA